MIRREIASWFATLNPMWQAGLLVVLPFTRMFFSEIYILFEN